MKIVFSHPTSNANVRAAAEGLEKKNLLQYFYTTVAVLPGSVLEILSRLPGLTEFKRRSFSATITPYIKAKPWHELGRMLAPKLKLSSLLRHESGIFSIDNVYHTLDKWVARELNDNQQQGATAVYGYEDGVAESFVAAKALQMQCLYDLPIGYWRSMHRMLQDAKEAHPEWAATLTGFNDSPIKLARKDEELRLADHIFVASSFTANTLKEYPGTLAPVSVIPYGFPPPVASRQYQPLHNRPLKILFVGGLSQRKGIANLFEATEAFGKKIELTVVGNKAVPDCEALNRTLTRHRWIPSLPHADILQLMRQQDVFIFPSLFEGFGLVITEAMSQGTPVITTERTAGPDIIQHGENGWLTEAGNTKAIENIIASILEQPAMLERVGNAAIYTAEQRPWEVYGKELASAIAALCVPKIG